MLDHLPGDDEVVRPVGGGEALTVLDLEVQVLGHEAGEGDGPPEKSTPVHVKAGRGGSPARGAPTVAAPPSRAAPPVTRRPHGVRQAVALVGGWPVCAAPSAVREAVLLLLEGQAVLGPAATGSAPPSTLRARPWPPLTGQPAPLGRRRTAPPAALLRCPDGLGRPWTFTVITMPIRTRPTGSPRRCARCWPRTCPPTAWRCSSSTAARDDDTRDVVARSRATTRVPARQPGAHRPDRSEPALAEARGDVIVRVGSHCAPCPGLPGPLRGAAGRDRRRLRRRHGREPALGRRGSWPGHRPGHGVTFGTGAGFRVGRTEAGPVDTLAFGAYRREVFERLGTFDEELVRNQDDEFNLRLTRAGGTIWMDPSLRSPTGPAATCAPVAPVLPVRRVQGAGRRSTGVASRRHLVSLALVAVLLGGLGLSLVTRRRGPSCWSPGRTWRARLPPRWSPVATTRPPSRSCLAFATLQLSYGTGWLVGLALAPPLRGLVLPSHEGHHRGELAVRAR